MSLSLYSQKQCDIGQHFAFCCIWVTWWRCFVCSWHVTADLCYFISYFCNSLKFNNASKITNNNPWLLPHSLMRKSHKKSALGTDKECKHSQGILHWVGQPHAIFQKFEAQRKGKRKSWIEWQNWYDISREFPSADAAGKMGAINGKSKWQQLIREFI